MGIHWKSKRGRKIIKARLVAKRFQENVEGIRTDSPNCSKYALIFVLVTAACHHWEINPIDFASAFHQGNPINRLVFLRPSKDVCPINKLWRLQRCIYGLNDAPCAWYNKVTEELRSTKAVRSNIDHAVFTKYDNNKLIGHLVSHVDDFVFGGQYRLSEDVFGKLKNRFNIRSEASISFKYVGLNVKQTRRCHSYWPNCLHWKLARNWVGRREKKNTHL